MIISWIGAKGNLFGITLICQLLSPVFPPALYNSGSSFSLPIQNGHNGDGPFAISGLFTLLGAKTTHFFDTGSCKNLKSAIDSIILQHQLRRVQNLLSKHKY